MGMLPPCYCQILWHSVGCFPTIPSSWQQEARRWKKWNLRTFITGPYMKKQLLIFFHSPEFDIVSVSWCERQVSQARAQMSGNGEERSISRSNFNYLCWALQMYFTLFLYAPDFANIGNIYLSPFNNFNLHPTISNLHPTSSNSIWQVQISIQRKSPYDKFKVPSDKVKAPSYKFKAPSVKFKLHPTSSKLNLSSSSSIRQVQISIAFQHE